jgi:hypothetical protein
LLSLRTVTLRHDDDRQLCVQIHRRLAEARGEIQRLEAARDALGKGADTAATLAPATRHGRHVVVFGELLGARRAKLF